MGRYSTFPTLIDECNNISIGFLLKNGYLKDNTNKSGIITWSWDGQKTDSISIRLIMDNRPRIIFDYKSDNEPRNYSVYLSSLPSNLGKGVLWYFICMHTGKRCRKLHLLDGYFIHRSALRGGMYESQTRSKSWRTMEKVYGSYFELDRHYEELYSKHFKKFYNGRPTKRYLKLMRKINEGERFPISEMKNLF